MRQAWMWQDLLLPESWKQRNWVADQHNCSCGLCRRRTRKILGNSREAIPIQEKKIRMSEDLDIYDECLNLEENIIKESNIDQNKLIK